MYGKRTVIAILAAINLLLLCMLLFSGSSLPRALAQAGNRGSGFVSVTAKAPGQTYDVVYVLDGTERKLYGFYPGGRRPLRLTATRPRDLTRDFQRQ